MDTAQVIWLAVAIFIVPGFILNLASGLRIPWAGAASVPTSFALFGFSGWLYGQIGIRYSPGSVIIFSLGICALALLWRGGFFLVGRRRRPAQGWAWLKAPGSLYDLRWIFPLAGAVAGSYLFLTRSVVLYQRNEHGLGAIFQGWDVHWHASEIRFIMERGIADPTRMGELRNIESQLDLYYPSGWHAGASIMANLLDLSPIEATNIAGLVIPAITLPLSIGLLAWRMVGNRGLTAQIAAGFAAPAIVAAPTIYWIGHYVGAWPYVAAMSMAGIVTALYMSVPAVPQRAFAAGLGLMGVVMVHPSAVTVIVMLLGLWWLFYLVFVPSRKLDAQTILTTDTAEEPTVKTRWGWALLSRLRDIAILAAAGILPAAMLLPQLLSGSEETEDVKSYTATEDISRWESWGNLFSMRTRHFEEFGELNWNALLLAAAIGAVVLLVWRRNVWALAFTALSAWIASNSLLPYADPWGEWLNIIGALHYATAHRLVMPVTMMIFAAAGVGLAVVIRIVCLGFITRPAVRTVSNTLSVIIAVGLAYLLYPVPLKIVEQGSYYSITAPNDDRMVSDIDLKAFEWLAQQPGVFDGSQSTVFGEPADGYGWMYAYNGIPAMSRHYAWPALPADNHTQLPYWWAHYIGIGNGGDPQQRNDVDDAVDALGINFFYISPPNFWDFQEQNMALTEWLFNAPGLTPVYRHANVSILAVNDHFTDAQLTAMRANSPDPLAPVATYGQLGLATTTAELNQPYYHRPTTANSTPTFVLPQADENQTAAPAAPAAPASLITTPSVTPQN
ncbi:DUF6541 family protein [Corynebacterium kutscheri]|uniref:Rhamnopyranosyltransferase n=1 Tax=Corynebacterium kutscheri TaxID=35755 RepID=A0AB38VQJ1_9CORY|nr:DUF6541 family protein [Corynebacterium kutscheri]VEH04871.1 Rhamnopyranosyltransferase [Corynebacterium kutscheri]